MCKPGSGSGGICLVADRGLISEDNLDTVEQAGCDWVLATRLHNRKDVAAVLAFANAADNDDWIEVTQFHSCVLDVSHDNSRYVVVFSDERERRDTLRRLQLINKTEDRLLALERRVARGELTDAEKIVAAAERILAKSPVRRLFTYDADDGRFVYDYDHDAVDYEQALAGHYVLHTSLSADTPPATVLACYQSLRAVEDRFRVLKDFVRLRPVYVWTETRVRGHIAICVLAAVIEALMRNALHDADVRDPDLDHQHLSARRALDELDKIRRVTLDTGQGPTIRLVTRRTRLHEQVLKAFDVNTTDWDRPAITT
ncbi:MAG TPA: IS1634 family transposase [Nitriliruptorales bacterium]|nr:IS1634 family transposase [Nitriliruptorales bacterium]